MESRGLRYFIGFIIVIGLLIFLFTLIFSGDDSKSKVPTSSRVLSSYANRNSEVRMTIDGPVNSDQDHRQIVVTVTQDRVEFKEIHGYNGNVFNSRVYNNTQASYEVFLKSLEHSDFTKGDVKNMNVSEHGYCPLGDRFVFELTDSGKSVERYWATTCGKPKTFLGNLGLVTSLFQSQVPEYHKLAENIPL